MKPAEARQLAKAEKAEADTKALRRKLKSRCDARARRLRAKEGQSDG